MKIHQLPQGAGFEYEGEAYVKTGPMFGTSRNGQKLIPKYAVLKVLGEPAPGSKIPGQSLSRNGVLEAFERFYARCESIVSAENQSELLAAHDEFKKSIG
jgi:hypothetical protein